MPTPGGNRDLRFSALTPLTHARRRRRRRSGGGGKKKLCSPPLAFIDGMIVPNYTVYYYSFLTHKMLFFSSWVLGGSLFPPSPFSPLLLFLNHGELQFF